MDDLRQKWETGERKKKKEKDCIRLRKPSVRNLKQKKGKRKVNDDFRHHICISVKKMFCNAQLFFVSVQRRLGVPILSFVSFCFISLCFMKCCDFCSTVHSEICAVTIEMHLFFRNKFLVLE